jgi:hypothetical protein
LPNQGNPQCDGPSYNFDYSKNDNQTFDVATYGNSTNGIEGPSKINVLNVNFFTTLSASKFNEFHVTYARELRPRNAVESFTDRSFDLPLDQLDRLYAPSDRDIRHKFNLFAHGSLAAGIIGNARIQARSAQPITPTRGGPDERNSIRKDNEFFRFDWRIMRPFTFATRYRLIPALEMFNTFNNKTTSIPWSRLRCSTSTVSCASEWAIPARCSCR